MVLRGSPSRGLNAICPYYTMFPITFPAQRLRKARAGDWVLDPFCGRGTTNYAARLRRMASIGIDVSPIATAVASAKFAYASYNEVVSVAAGILQARPPIDLPDGEFWRLCYHPNTLRDICKLREALLIDCRSDARVILRALVMGILHGPRNVGPPTYLSNQMPRTYATKPASAVRFWKRRDLEPVYVDVLSAVQRRAEYSLKRLPPPTLGHALLADSRAIDYSSFGVSFSWVITSPPYFHMNTYVPDQWLRAWFVGGSPEVDYSSEQQVALGTQEGFVRSLADIWTNIAKACVDGAHLHVRLGSLPSDPSKPDHILRASIHQCGAGWRVRSLRSAGHAHEGKRQAMQFGRQPGNAVQEFDLHATLEG